MSQKYAVLGLLNISPMTGYLIKKNLEVSMHKFWPISYGGLYPALHTLAKHELVHVSEPGGTRGQITYHITDLGRQELNKWLLSTNTTIQTKDEFLLKVYLSKDLNPSDRKEILKNYLVTKLQLKAELDELFAQKDEKELYHDDGTDIVTQYIVLTLQYEIQLLEKLIQEGQLELGE